MVNWQITTPETRPDASILRLKSSKIYCHFSLAIISKTHNVRSIILILSEASSSKQFGWQCCYSAWPLAGLKIKTNYMWSHVIFVVFFKFQIKKNAGGDGFNQFLMDIPSFWCMICLCRGSDQKGHKKYWWQYIAIDCGHLSLTSITPAYTITWASVIIVLRFRMKFQKTVLVEASVCGRASAAFNNFLPARLGIFRVLPRLAGKVGGQHGRSGALAFMNKAAKRVLPGLCSRRFSWPWLASY